jgi:hypothetical protein
MSRLIMNRFGACKGDVDHVEHLMRIFDIEEDVLENSTSLEDVIEKIYMSAMNKSIPNYKLRHFLDSGDIEIDCNLQSSSLTMWGEKVDSLKEIRDQYYMNELLDIEFIRLVVIDPTLKEGSQELDLNKTIEDSAWNILKPKSLEELKDNVNSFYKDYDSQRKLSKSDLKKTYHNPIVRNNYEPFSLMFVKATEYSDFERVENFLWLHDQFENLIIMTE